MNPMLSKSTLKVTADIIPAAIRSLPQWVAWRREERGGKTTKAPIDAKSNGKLTYAKSNDPTTWATLDAAIDACGRHLELAGVGFCFAPNDGLTGIDLDHVIDPDTGELQAEAVEILDRFTGTYCEVSPSGTGLRLFAFGKPARSGKNTGKVKWCEVYSHPSNRYLTVTGNHWPGSATEVTEQQDALDWLHQRFMESTGLEPVESSSSRAAGALSLDDAAVLDKARKAKNGGDFARLWAGDTSGHGGDDSAADLALCNLLAFWTGGDADRVDRLFRQSGLMRKKWDTKRGEATYGASTVAKAIAGCGEFYGDRVRSESSTRYQAEAVGGLAAPVEDGNFFSDYGNIVKLIEHLQDRIAYTPGLDWLLYNPDTGIWEPEPGSERIKRIVMESLRDSWGTVFDAAQQDVDGLKKQLKQMDAEDPQAAMIAKQVKQATARRDKVFAWLRQCETAYRIRSTLELAEGYFWTAPNEWDANPHILVCANGVLDLKSGALLPHAPGYRATKTTGTDYRPNATHPAWDAAVELLKSEGDRYAFIQQFCGSGLHGANPNERVVIFQGDGGTGKGTLLTAIHNALGDYVATVEVGSLLATDWRKQNKSAPREDLLKLRGARFVYPSIEPPKDSKLDDGSIKALTGNDAITARYPHGKNSITFLPVFKLAIQTNFPLQTEFDDPGMRRRVIVVPFNQKPKKPDPTVKNSLMHDPDARAAVLAWLYEGYRTWLQNDFALPESALASEATAEYWADMNPYEQFARDVGLRFGKGLKCLKPRMTGAFKAWRDEPGRRDAAIKGFPHWLKSMDCFDAQASDHQRYWYGVAFISDPQPQPQQPQQPPVSGNMVVELQYSTSTDEFHETGGYNGCCGYEPPQTGEIGEKIDKNGQAEGGNGRDGTVKPENALEKPPKGTFPHNPSNCSNPSKQPPFLPVETEPETGGDALLLQHPHRDRGEFV